MLGDVRPTEELCDGLDNDCDGIVDNFRRACYEGDRKYVGKGACKAGTQLCTAGAWGACEGQVLPGKTFSSSSSSCFTHEGRLFAVY